MSFQLYFAGSFQLDADSYLQEQGCNRLFSQLLDRRGIDKWCSYFDDCNSSHGKLLIDSGAFSAHTKNTSIDVDSYIEYINSISKYVTIFAQLDCIPGEFAKPKTRQQLIEAPIKSWENYLYMVERVEEPDKLIPVFHQGEDFRWLKNILEYTNRGKHIPYIGISPANDKHPKDKEYFISQCFDVIKRSSNPDVCTHAFGMTYLEILERYPFTSADSTTWLMNAINGMIMTKYGSLVVSKNRLNDKQNVFRMPKESISQLEKYVNTFGYTLEDLSTQYKARMFFNIKYYKYWCDNYVYKPVTRSIRKKLV